MTNLFERLSRLYRDGEITQAELHSAVGRGWITEEQYQMIIEHDPEATTEDFENALTELGVK